MRFLNKIDLWQRVVFLLKNLDMSFSIIGLIISFLMIIKNILFFNSIMMLYTFGLLFTSFLIYLTFKTKFCIKYQSLRNTVRVKLFSMIFFILYSLSIIVLFFRSDTYERPLLYFCIIILMFGVLAGGCLCADRRHIGLIFIQILLLAMNIGWSHLMIVPSLIGIDPWVHSSLTNEIINGFHIPGYDNSITYVYSNRPIFHILSAITSIFTTYPYKYATILSVSFGQIVCNSLFVFLFAYYVFNNHRIGLLAALLAIIGDTTIQWTYISIPNGLGGTFLLILIFLVLTKKNLLLLIILMADIILTHDLVSAFTTILLFVIFVSFKYRELLFGKIVANVNVLIPLIFSFAMCGWWIYGSNTIKSFSTFADEGFDLGFLLNPRELTSNVITPQIEVIFPNLGRYLFFSLAIIGILYMISLKSNNLSFTLAIVILTTIIFPFIFYITGRSIFETRFTYFSLIFLAIPLALTLYFLGTCKMNHIIMPMCLVIGLIVILSFLSIMSISACVDNHAFASITGRTLYYSQPEIFGSDFFGKKAKGIISCDKYSVSPASSVFLLTYDFDSSRLQNLEYSLNRGEFYHDGSIKIIRRNFISDFQKKGYLSSNIQPDINKFLSNSGFNRIYDNPAMTGYIG